MLLNLTIANLRLAYLKKPLFTTFPHLNLHHSTFVKFQSFIIFNSWKTLSLSKVTFKQGLSSIINFNRNCVYISQKFQNFSIGIEAIDTKENEILIKDCIFDTNIVSSENDNPIIYITNPSSLKCAIKFENCFFHNLLSSKQCIYTQSSNLSINSCCFYAIQSSQTSEFKFQSLTTINQEMGDIVSSGISLQFITFTRSLTSKPKNTIFDFNGQIISTEYMNLTKEDAPLLISFSKISAVNSNYEININYNQFTQITGMVFLFSLSNFNYLSQIHQNNFYNNKFLSSLLKTDSPLYIFNSNFINNTNPNSDELKRERSNDAFDGDF